MEQGSQSRSIWTELSAAFAKAAGEVEGSIVAVQAARHNTVSGVVWRPGVVVSAHSRVHRMQETRILHADGKVVKATVVGADAGTDLAVLRLEGEQLPAAKISAGARPRVGDLALAVGRSRLGDVAASAGIVARVGAPWRTWRGGQIDRLIRPDVRLYVGQQGSALVNETGEVLGINSTALAPAAVITVPTETVHRVVDAILERGRVPKPFLGIATQAVPVPQAMRAQFPAGTEYALLVMHVEPEAAAAKAGVLVGDMVVSIGGRGLGSVRQFLVQVMQMRVGETVPVTVLRGGIRVDLTLQVGERD